MPNIYIANSTKQNYEFRYRISGNPKIYVKQIPLGTQIMLDQTDLNTDEIENIIAQHRGDAFEYMVESGKIDRTKGHIGLIYRIGSPVDAELIANTIVRNDAVLTKDSEKMRTEALLATDKKMNSENLAHSNLTSEVVQEIKAGVNFDDMIAQGVEVTN